MNPHQKLITLMQAEIELIEALSDSLVQEAKLLEQHDLQGLEAVTVTKNRQVEDLDALGRQRKTVMDNMIGADSAACDIDEMFANDPQISVLWKELSSAAERCRDMNRANGTVVEAVTRHVRQTLDVLQGKHLQAAAPGQVYDRTGHASGQAIKHTLVQV